jgi:hypothetical protein
MTLHGNGGLLLNLNDWFEKHHISSDCMRWKIQNLRCDNKSILPEINLFCQQKENILKHFGKGS